MGSYEYLGDNDSFQKYTLLLHVKEGTYNIAISDLEIMHKGVLKDIENVNLPDQDKLVIDLIFEEADKIAASPDETVELEEKIVLAIAIRLQTENYIMCPFLLHRIVPVSISHSDRVL